MNRRLLYGAPVVALVLAACGLPKAGATAVTATASRPSDALASAVNAPVPTLAPPTPFSLPPTPSATTLAPAPIATTKAVPEPPKPSSTPRPVPTKPAPTVVALACRASVSNTNPHRDQTVDVLVQTTASAQLTVTAHYKSRDTVEATAADGTGHASLPFDVSTATYGFTVRVDVAASIGGQHAACSTSFTPAAR